MEDKKIDSERCREELCTGLVPQGKSLRDRTCRILHLCRYCYRMKFPKRGPSNLPPCRHGSQRLMTPWEKAQLEKRQLPNPDETNWTPKRYAKWMDYWGNGTMDEETKDKRRERGLKIC